MQQGNESNNGSLGAANVSLPLLSPNRRIFSTPQYLNSNGSIIASSFFQPLESPSPLPFSRSTSVSLTPSSHSFDDEDPTSTDQRLYLARLTLQYQEMVELYELRIHEISQEAEALRCENLRLRATNSKLARRLSLLSAEKNGRVASSAGRCQEMSLLGDFGHLHVGAGDPAAENTPSPTSVLQCQGSPFPGKPPEQRFSLPKSISIRSSGFLKDKVPKGCPSPDGRLRVSPPVIVETRKMYVPSGSQEEEPLEFEVYNQGMLKTELCNKWQETGACPYGNHCQFAHGIGELRPVIRHPRYKTEVCRMVLAGDVCPYGHRCHFRHSLTPRDSCLMGPT